MNHTLTGFEPPKTLASLDRSCRAPSLPFLSRSLVAALVPALMLGFAARAQVAPATTAGEGARAKEEAIVLSPFTVNAEADTGYAATATLAGSRFKTELKDTAASISVFTGEFLSDIGATNFESALAYSASAQLELGDSSSDGAVPNGNAFQSGPAEFRVRGQPASRSRDYYTLRIAADTYNAERIEDSRGPNSVLFGFGSPGGIINISSKQARLDRSFRAATIGGGSFASNRETFDVNQVLVKDKLSLRLNTLHDQSNKYQEYAFSRDRRIDLAAKLQATPTLQIRGEFERALQKENKARPFVMIDGGLMLWKQVGAPTFATAINSNPALSITKLGTARRLTYIGNTGQVIETGSTLVTTDTNLALLDRSVADPTINYGGPGQVNDSASNLFSAAVEKRFGQKTFLELSYNRQEQDVLRFNPGQNNMKLWGDPNQFLRTGVANPYVGQIFMETAGNSWERNASTNSSELTRATLSTEIDFGKWGNYRIAALAERDDRTSISHSDREVWEGRPFNSAPENAANQVRRRNYAIPGVWNTYFISGAATTGLIKGAIDPITGRTLNSTWVPRSQSQENDPETQDAWLVSGQARYFGGRLIIGAGMRQDHVDILDRTAQRDPATNMWSLDYATSANVTRDAHNSTFGVVAHVTPNISLLYNQADNQGLPGNERILDLNDLSRSITAPNSKGQGRDIGIGFTLFGGRVNARATYYTTDAIDLVDAYGATGIAPESVAPNILSALVAAGKITQAVADAHTPIQSGITFDKASKGYELSLTANLTRNWRLQASGSYTDTKQANFGPEVATWMTQEIAYWKSFNSGSLMTGQGRTIDDSIAVMLDGYRAQADLQYIGELGLRKYKANFFTRYDIPWERLKGAYVGGGYRYQSKNLAGSDVNKRLGFYGKPLAWQADFLAGYKFSKAAMRRARGILDGLTIQLNVYNLFDDDTTLVTRILSDGVTVQRAVYQAPRTWRLEAKLAF